MWRTDVGKLPLLLLCLAAAAAQLSEKHKPDALVEMVPGVGDKVFGKLALFKKEDGVYIEGIIHNLKPGLHGFHVHEKGLLGNKCMDGGPHFNPFEKVHAGPKDQHRHAGDLGNVYADKNGVAKISIFDGHISLHPHAKTFIGKRSFIVHDRPDDLGRGGDDESLRTGNAGGRLSCGIVIVLGHSLKEPPPVYRPKHKGHHGGSFGGRGFGGGLGHQGGGGGGYGHHGDGGGGGGYHHDDDDHFFGGFSDNSFGFGDDDGHSSHSHSHYHQRPKPIHNGGRYHGSGSHPHQGRELAHPFHFGQKLQSFGSSPSQHKVEAPHGQNFGGQVTAAKPVVFRNVGDSFSQPLLPFW